MAASSPDIPLRIGTAQAFAQVRQFCHDAGYDDDTALCRIFSVKELHETDRLDWETIDLSIVPTALRWCIDVFYRGNPLPEADARAMCGDAVLAAFLELRLLVPARNRPAAMICPVWLYPVGGFLVASDRRDDASGATEATGDDVVFPGIDVGTMRFLHFMPDARGGEALDLCGGCGVGALHLSRTASHAITLDVTPRSTAFAEFNARLNDRPVASLCGDLYAPVQGRRFDLITAHPPYVPTYGRSYVFRDGGDSGEIVIRRIVEGLASHLRSDGTAMLVCAGRDTAEESFEQRVMTWLGPAVREFDMVFGLIRNLTIDEVLDSLQSRSQPMTQDEAQELRTRLKMLGTRQFVYGPLVFRRSAQPVDAPPLRIRLGNAATAADLSRLLTLRAFRRQAAFKPWLAAARPRFAQKVELVARNAAESGRLGPTDFTFRSEGAFLTALRPDPWMVPVLATFDGTRSTREAFDGARSAGELPDAFMFDDFASLISLMMENGILEVERDRRAQ